MVNYTQHLLINTSSIKDALIKLDALAKDAILFIIDDSGKLQGSLTDGDVRRGLLKGVKLMRSLQRYYKLTQNLS